MSASASQYFLSANQGLHQWPLSSRCDHLNTCLFLSLSVESCRNIYRVLAQMGAWGCSDVFNRISVEVLPVVAVQVRMIAGPLPQALKKNPIQVKISRRRYWLAFSRTMWVFTSFEKKSYPNWVLEKKISPWKQQPAEVNSLFVIDCKHKLL